MGGRVFITNVDGEITGKTMGGNLKFSHLKNFIDFKTMAGDIDFRESSSNCRDGTRVYPTYAVATSL